MQGQSRAEQDLGAIDGQTITRLLRRMSSGDKDAFDQLLPLVYDQLRRRASRCLLSERGDHTLRATALVHDAYIRLVDAGGWRDRVHFYAVAARVMRHILVDYARAGKRQKRGEGLEHIALNEAILVSSEPSQDLSALDESLNRLAAHDPRKAKSSNCCSSAVSPTRKQGRPWESPRQLSTGSSGWRRPGCIGI